jgi:hypothetical protein
MTKNAEDRSEFFSPDYIREVQAAVLKREGLKLIDEEARERCRTWIGQAFEDAHAGKLERLPKAQS